jgi:predicted nucleic acid-binding protein
MKNSCVVVDSNLAVFTVIDTELSKLATRVWLQFSSSGIMFYAPHLWIYETTSVIRKFYAFGTITKTEAESALILLDQLQVRFVPDDLGLRKSALSWATRLRQKAAYDGFYLAAAEQLDAELWTADQALVNNARQLGASWVHWMGEIT